MADIRVVALIEAATVTGPAKNLIRFCGLARGLGAEVSIATFCRGGGPAPAFGQVGDLPHHVPHRNQFIDAVRAAGIEIDIIAERFRFDTSVIGQLTEILRRRAPDIVQTHGVKSHFLMRFTGLRRKYRWIAYHHGYTVEDLKMRAYNQLNRWTLPKADRVITVCLPFADMLTRSGVARERIRVLANSIETVPAADEESIRAVRERWGIEPGERVILCVGRFSREKAQADLIRAVARLGKTGDSRPVSSMRRGENRETGLLSPVLVLVLVGDGPERERLGQAARAAWLEARVVFAGHQREVGPYYGLADVFVLPSHSEGSPNVLLEAMAAGVPVVATAVGGVPELVENEESALLVRPGDSATMAEAIGRLLADRELAERLARNAAVAVKARFSPDAYARALVGLYGEVR
jgi:glycosyltransferase involved in cell wall biosynthesis